MSDPLCCICHLQYTQLSPPMQISICKHYFHESCIKKWNEECSQNQKVTKCPMCMTEFKVTDLSIQVGILSAIIKKNQKLDCRIQMTNQDVLQLQIDVTRQVSELFDMLVIYNAPFTKNDLQITFDSKTFTYEDHKNKLNYDLGFYKDCYVTVTPLGKMLQVFLVNFEGQSQKLNVKLTMSILDFCNLVQYQTGINKEKIRFQVQSKPFDYRTPGTLQDLPISENSTIHLLGRLLGGE